MQYPTLINVANYLKGYLRLTHFPTKSIIATLGSSVGSGAFYPLNGAVVSYQVITGIDIPVYIGNPESNKVIMILEQDPLRKETDKNLIAFNKLFSTHGIVGTPNALHLPRHCYPNSGIYWDLINLCLNKKYCVYISDVYKIYAPNLVKSKGRFGINEQKLLIDEINLTKPCKIILTGEVAQSAFSLISGALHTKPCPLYVPHLTGARARTWIKYGVSPATNINKLAYISKFI